MHWNVPPDALPGSATFNVFWTAGLTTLYIPTLSFSIIMHLICSLSALDLHVGDISYSRLFLHPSKSNCRDVCSGREYPLVCVLFGPVIPTLSFNCFILILISITFS